MSGHPDIGAELPDAKQLREEKCKVPRSSARTTDPDTKDDEPREGEILVDAAIRRVKEKRAADVRTRRLWLSPLSPDWLSLLAAWGATLVRLPRTGPSSGSSSSLSRAACGASGWRRPRGASH